MEAQTYGREEENVATIASPYRRRRFIDTQYGFRNDCELLMICDSAVFIDTHDNIAIK